MNREESLEKQSNLQVSIKIIKLLLNKELLIGLYFWLFIFGMTIGVSFHSYNEFRIIQITLLSSLVIWAWFYHQYYVTRLELLFFSYIIISSLFWQQPLFVITDMLLVYLLYKSFHILNYQLLLTKLIVLSSLSLFLLLPLSLYDYINTGIYHSNWYPEFWNIRVYNSYFLVISIFATWFYITEKKYRYYYLLYLLLAFLAVLLDGGRSATLSYTVFIATISILYPRVRWQLILVYATSWLAYVMISYIASINVASTSLRIMRSTRNDRYELWINAFQCWSQHPLFGCGFYQLDKYQHIAAHPHNLFIQVLTETGLIGFGFLAFIMFKIAKNIGWHLKKNYFVVAALLAVSIDLSLSGIHIYPVTQMALLWLFVFLLKNPEFSHSQYFNQSTAIVSYPKCMVALTIYVIIAIWFIYLSVQAHLFTTDMMMTPPRFWEYGYRLF
ncbi:O-antigen ligase family protein [Psychrobacter sp. LV10R520-6]|uniref:O-antigen ligase family protein n=1 Tax=Psychrobacter sp. LV10R520-6 TaxID=1415574 RepID=UPI0024C635D1|nr:O-antigen ligase family protein [Psychrobacter sp. LV10R520-6]SNT71395.1 O-antigen ligase [Psychrobacter sp. LV10R520-6]